MVAYGTKSTSIDLARPSHVKQADVLPERAVDELPDPEIYQYKRSLQDRRRKINPAILYGVIHFLISTTDSGIIDLHMIGQIYSEGNERNESEDDTVEELINKYKGCTPKSIRDTIDDYLVPNGLLCKTKRGGGFVYYLPEDIDVAPVFSDPTVDIKFNREEIDTDEVYRGQLMVDKLLTPLLGRWTSIRQNVFLIIGDTAFAVSIFWFLYATTTLWYGFSEVDIVTASLLWALVSFALAAISVGLTSSFLNEHTTILQRLHRLPRQLFGTS